MHFHEIRISRSNFYTYSVNFNAAVSTWFVSAHVRTHVHSKEYNIITVRFHLSLKPFYSPSLCAVLHLCMYTVEIRLILQTHESATFLPHKLQRITVPLFCSCIYLYTCVQYYVSLYTLIPASTSDWSLKSLQHVRTYVHAYVYNSCDNQLLLYVLTYVPFHITKWWILSFTFAEHEVSALIEELLGTVGHFVGGCTLHSPCSTNPLCAFYWK